MRLQFLRLMSAVVLAPFGLSVESRVDAGESVLVVHGGVGVLPEAEMTPVMRERYETDLRAAVLAGHAILARGGTSLDAVEAAIKVLEDSSRFNAGKGAVLTREGRCELDASIADGGTRKVGSVAGVTVVKNPISAARAVMEKSPHVFLAGAGADRFAREQKLKIVDPSYFENAKRPRAEDKKPEPDKGSRSERQQTGGTHFGTVGAVALDQHGRLAAGVSTGGITDKLPGRVGDSAVYGAGLFADDGCAISCTGDGEFFIRFTAASDLASLVRYKGQSLENAAHEVINGKLKRAGAEGGAIAVDGKGHLTMPFNTAGMYRGFIRSDGVPHVFVYGNGASGS